MGPWIVIVDPQGVLDQIQVCLCAQLTDSDIPVCRCCVVAGNVALDNCCEEDDCEGQAWVRLVRVYPSDRFPAAGAQKTACPIQWAAVVEVGVVRCAPTLNNQGEVPTCEELAASAAGVHADMVAMYRAVGCCGLDSDEVVLGEWSPIGPEGGCVGGRMTATVAIAACLCDGFDGGS